jgi:hypothetical protein
MLVNQRCCYAPIKVTLDGRLVNDPDRLERLLPHGPMPHPNFLVPVAFIHYRCEVLVERNYLANSGPRFLASLPTARAGRHLGLEEQHLAVIPGKSHAGNLVFGEQHSQSVHLCQWRGADDPFRFTSTENTSWALTPTQGAPPGIYPMLRGATAGGMKSHVVGVREEDMAPFLSQVRLYQEDRGARGYSHFWDHRLLWVRRRVTLPLGLRGPSHLVPVLHGVALDPIELPESLPGLQAIAADDGLTTDLSQLKAVESPVIEEMRRSIAADAREMVQAVQAVLEPHYPDWICQHIKERLKGFCRPQAGSA